MDQSNRSLVPVPTSAPAVIDDGFIKSRIHTIRGVQVMLDRDLAQIYGVSTSRLNEQVKRNAGRFPPNFMFRLSRSELDDLKSQTATSSSERSPNDRLKSQNATSSWGGVRKPSTAFTEHGVIMLASVLRSDAAVAASVRITEVFVAMRKALASIAPLLNRIDVVERRQIADQARNEERFDTIFKAMDGGDFPPQNIFYDGQLWDARAFVDRLVKSARKSLLLVDNFSRMPPRDSSRAAFVVSSLRSAPLSFGTGGTCSRRPVSSSSRRPRPLAAAAPRAAAIPIRLAPVACRRARCRVSRFGASLKDLGKKCFGFTKMDPAEIPGLKARL